ncbi:MAG: tyrosine protein phosphatase [Phycisphaeraceae bacterium]|nr:tyrosine protein phosphatase [Phycisphaeraceae bacterium]
MRPEIYWIPCCPIGRLAIMPRPRAGDWLEEELASIRAAGVDVLVSHLTNDEMTELELQREPDICRAAGLRFVSFPIQDRNVPSSRERFVRFVNRVYASLQQDERVAIHCRAGIGRSSLTAASLLVKCAYSADEAYEAIAEARGITVPDTDEQRHWLKSATPHLRNSK